MQSLNSNPLLSVRGLRVALQTAHGPVEALRGVDFEMQRGDTLGLIGESGCGKSLTALAIMGLLPDSAKVSGSIQLNSVELSDLNDAAMCKIRDAGKVRARDRIAVLAALNLAFDLSEKPAAPPEPLTTTAAPSVPPVVEGDGALLLHSLMERLDAALGEDGRLL